MKKKIKQLIIIEGPTASGKTALSVELAKHFSTVILSADSRQFYKELSIGTAKPSNEEQQGILHYFIDSHSINEEVTAANYAREGLKILDEEFKVHDTIVMVGGSGMFIDALAIGLDDIPTDKALREELNTQLTVQGLDTLLLELKEKDPNFYAVVDRQNPVRVIRALEAIRLTDKPFSELRKAVKKELPFSIRRFIIDHQRDKLYERIEERVDLMMNAGLLQEVENVFSKRHLNALRTVGYTELFAYLNNETTLEEAVALIKQNSRRYAKRQLTWFRKHHDAVWIPFDKTEKMVQKVLDELVIH